MKRLIQVWLLLLMTQVEAGFTPADLPNLQMWIDATDTSTLFQDDAGTLAATNEYDEVRRIEDLSGNGYHVQTGASSPLSLRQGGVFVPWFNHANAAWPQLQTQLQLDLRQVSIYYAISPVFSRYYSFHSSSGATRFVQMAEDALAQDGSNFTFIQTQIPRAHFNPMLVAYRGDTQNMAVLHRDQWFQAPTLYDSTPLTAARLLHDLQFGFQGLLHGAVIVEGSLSAIDEANLLNWMRDQYDIQPLPSQPWHFLIDGVPSGFGSEQTQFLVDLQPVLAGYHTTVDTAPAFTADTLSSRMTPNPYSAGGRLVVMAGYYDCQLERPAATVIAEFEQYLQAREAEGWDLRVGTVRNLPQFNPAQRATCSALNDYLRANWPVIELDRSPVYVTADTVHWTSEMHRYVAALIDGAYRENAETDLSLSLSDGLNHYRPGASSRYTVTAFNPGPGAFGPARRVKLRFSVPAGIERMDWSSQPIDGAQVVANANGTVLARSGGAEIELEVELPAGARVELAVRVAVANGTTAPLDATAALVLPDGSADPYLANNAGVDVNQPVLGPNPQSGYAVCANPGQEGPVLIENPATVVNGYYSPGLSAQTLSSGQRCLPLAPAFSRGFGFPASGDRLLVIQVQGGDFTTTDDASYGAYDEAAALAGVHEFVRVDGALGSGLYGCGVDELPISGGSGSDSPTLGLIFDYAHEPQRTSGRRVVQYVRIPQYLSLDFSGAGSLQALPFDGYSGGLLAVDVARELNLGTEAGQPRLLANGAGFRGGPGNVPAPAPSSAFRASLLNGHGLKGESLFGTPAPLVGDPGADQGYPLGSALRGAPGSAGGGGHDCSTNAAGGGGAGHGGVGGRGGRCASDAEPASSAGLGGRLALQWLVAGRARMLLGSGGGSAGDGSPGGAGGGLIWIAAQRLTGAGQLQAHGAKPVGGAAGGGGGAGGDVVVLTNLAGLTQLADLELQATGGGGADSSGPGGPGGGGGGGRIALADTNPPSVLRTVVDAGPAGQGPGGQDLGSSGGGNGSLLLDFDPYNQTPGAKPGFLCSNGTVPVSLVHVRSRVDRGELVVEWATAAEAGTIGFKLITEQSRSAVARVPAGGQVLASGSSTRLQRYRAAVAADGADRFYLEEIGLHGESQVHGPFIVGGERGTERIAPALDWPTIAADLDHHAAQARGVRMAVARNQPGLQLEWRLAESGWYRIEAAALSQAGFDPNLLRPPHLHLMRNGQPWPMQLATTADGRFAALDFVAIGDRSTVGSGSDSYRLIERPAHVPRRTIGRVYAAGQGEAGGSLPVHFVHRPQRLYGFASPTGDPWFAATVRRQSAGATSHREHFELPAVAASSTAELAVWLFGGIDDPGPEPDHRLELWFNGQRLGEHIFDGAEPLRLDYSLPAGLLRSGTNQLELRLLANAHAVDIVHFEGLELRYGRVLEATSGAQYEMPATQTGYRPEELLYAGGFEAQSPDACAASRSACHRLHIPAVAPELRLLQRSADGDLRELWVPGRSATSAVTLAIDTHFGRKLEFWAPRALDPALISPAFGPADPLGSEPADLLIISHPAFLAVAEAYAQARSAQGVAARAVDVEFLYPAFSGGKIDDSAISLAIAKAHRELGVSAVLLVGGDTYDPNDHLGLGSRSLIPTPYRSLHPYVRFAPVDSAYGDLNHDGLPDLAVGRWPVYTLAAAQAIAARSLLVAGGSRADQGVFVADRRLGATDYADSVRRFADWYAPGQSSPLILLDQYADSSLAWTDLIAALQQRRSVLTWFGHSSPAAWARDGFLSAASVYDGALTGVDAMAVVQLGCWGGYAVDPYEQNLVQALFSADGPAVAMIGAAALTEEASDLVIARYLLPALRRLTVGEALLQARRHARSERASAIDVWQGMQLYGDPTLRVAH